MKIQITKLDLLSLHKVQGSTASNFRNFYTDSKFSEFSNTYKLIILFFDGLYSPHFMWSPSPSSVFVRDHTTQSIT